MSFIPWSIASSRALRRSISCLLALFLTESVYIHGRPSELLPARHCHRLLRRLDFALGLCRLRLRQRRSLGGGAGGVRQPRRGGHRRRRRERRDTGAGCIGETGLSTVLLVGYGAFCESSTDFTVNVTRLYETNVPYGIVGSLPILRDGLVTMEVQTT